MHQTQFNSRPNFGSGWGRGSSNSVRVVEFKFTPKFLKRKSLLLLGEGGGSSSVRVRVHFKYSSSSSSVPISSSSVEFKIDFFIAWGMDPEVRIQVEFNSLFFFC